MSSQLAKLIRNGCSILIPTWNNLPYLKACIDSLHKHSTFPHEIVLHINDGSDGTLDYARSQKINHSHSTNNAGVCKAMNAAAKRATQELLFYFNDDMIALPDWDTELARFCEENELNTDCVASCTMIEPTGHNDCCLAPYDYGQSLESFREHELLQDLPLLREKKPTTHGSTWPPNVVHRDLWNLVGGYSEEFSPGWGSDPDFIAKLYSTGIRTFVGVGRSLVYHFGSKTTRTKLMEHNPADQQFLLKWGMSIDYFQEHVLKRGKHWQPVQKTK